MTQAELLRHLVESLEELGIDYMIVGSHASIYYGEPRFTQDVDVVVELTPSALPGFLSRFPPAEFYVSEDAARDAVAQCGAPRGADQAAAAPATAHWWSCSPVPPPQPIAPITRPSLLSGTAPVLARS